MAKKPRPETKAPSLPAGHVSEDLLATGDRFYIYGTDVATVIAGGDAHALVYEHNGKRFTGLPPTRAGIGWELVR